jgi:hypothetical protein
MSESVRTTVTCQDPGDGSGLWSAFSGCPVVLSQEPPLTLIAFLVIRRASTILGVGLYHSGTQLPPAIAPVVEGCDPRYRCRQADVR